MTRYLLPIAAALMIGAASVGYAQRATHGSGAMDEKAITKMVKEMMPNAKDSASTRAYKEAHLKMMQGMHIAYSGDSDTDFARGMVAHHKGAIDMAEVQLKFGKDPEMRKLSEEIIKAQGPEISQMNAWLKAKGK